MGRSQVHAAGACTYLVRVGPTLVRREEGPRRASECQPPSSESALIDGPEVATCVGLGPRAATPCPPWCDAATSGFIDTCMGLLKKTWG